MGASSRNFFFVNSPATDWAGAAFLTVGKKKVGGHLHWVDFGLDRFFDDIMSLCRQKSKVFVAEGRGFCGGVESRLKENLVRIDIPDSCH